MKLFKALLTILSVAIICAQALAGNLATAALFALAVSAVHFGLNDAPQARALGHLCANTLTNLIPDFYAALDVVSREITGAIPAVMRDARADRCALNATMRIPQTRANSAAGNVTAAMSLPTAADQTVDNVGFQITKSRFAPFSWTGEEQGAMDAGPGYLTLRQDQIAQAIRSLVNEVENDLCDAAALGASRAYGTAGTTPFDSTNKLAFTAQIRKILDDNGAPASARSLIIDTTAGAALRTLTELTKVNESGTAMTLRDGELLNLHGFSVKESAQIGATVAGTGANYLVDLVAGYAIGDTALHVDTGTGTIPTGSVITIGSHKYLVTSGFAGDGDGDITIAAPGLRAAVANNTAITVNSSGTANFGLSSNAILLGTRLPALPQEGDIALDREIVTDPRTGLTFEVAAYPGYRMVTYHVMLAWGVKVIKPEHCAVLFG